MEKPKTTKKPSARAKAKSSGATPEILSPAVSRSESSASINTLSGGPAISSSSSQSALNMPPPSSELVEIAPEINKVLKELQPSSVVIMNKFAAKYSSLSKDDRKIFKDIKEYWKSPHILSDWSNELFNVTPSVLLNLLNDTNRSGLKLLMEIGAAYLANQLSELSIDQIRERMMTKDDLTPEEKEILTKENEILEA